MRTAVSTSLRALSRDPELLRFVAIAGSAMALDLVSKFVAAQWLGDDRIVSLTDRLSLLLVWNTGLTGGVSIGPFTAHFNAIITTLAIGLVLTVVKPLAKVDGRAVMSLGLVTGGAIGNLASIVSGPPGVADFIGVRLDANTTMVANVADLLLWSGALLLVPVAWTLIKRVREERQLQLDL